MRETTLTCAAWAAQSQENCLNGLGKLPRWMNWTPWAATLSTSSWSRKFRCAPRTSCRFSLECGNRLPAIIFNFFSFLFDSLSCWNFWVTSCWGDRSTQKISRLGMSGDSEETSAKRKTASRQKLRYSSYWLKRVYIFTRCTVHQITQQI